MSNSVSDFPAAVCPLDHQPLAAQGEELACAAGHRYPVRDGIPRLLAPESNYAEAFGAQWHHYRVTQLDSYTRTSLSRDRLRRCVGEEIWSRLSDPAERIEVLEAGCGAGRFTECLLKLPGASVSSTDLSSAVEPNQVNCPQSPRHRIIQCDIGRFPFAPAQFDVVVCLGVVQHTQNSERTIANLYAQVKPGGWLVIDHYPRDFAHYTRLGERLLRPLLKRLSPQRGIAVTHALTRWFFPLHRAVRHVRPAQMLLSRVSPVLTYFRAFPELDDRLQYEWAELDTHDSLTDWYKHVRTPRGIRAALMALGATDLWIERGGNGIEARCRRPA
ncbi:MAG TPA: methyltransferase domain-containing protein [Steroidobacteraceae bacterium]|nr:methyltransferase domain-containing protein [Steroidobacteraceae bacterium]